MKQAALLLAATLLLAHAAAPAALKRRAPRPAPQPTAAQPQPKPLFSEDFESGALDPALWSQQITGGNTIAVQSDKAAHGKYALLVRCPAPSDHTYAFIMAHAVPDALRHHLFGRAYVFVAPALPDRHTILLTAGTSGFPKYKYEEVASAHARFQLTYVDQVANGEDYHSAGQVPLGRWFLLEWEFNDHPNQAAVWVDGQPVLDTPFTYKTPGPSASPSSGPPPSPSTDLVGGFTDIAFGFRLWGAAPAPFDIYYDDIALDTHRLGPIN
jgi:hypothetical protein